MVALQRLYMHGDKDREGLSMDREGGTLKVLQLWMQKGGTKCLPLMPEQYQNPGALIKTEGEQRKKGCSSSELKNLNTQVTNILKWLSLHGSNWHLWPNISEKGGSEIFATVKLFNTNAFRPCFYVFQPPPMSDDAGVAISIFELQLRGRWVANTSMFEFS